MRVSMLETKEAEDKFKLGAYLDARVKSYAASTGYSEAQKVKAERMKIVLDLVYSADSIYVTFRKKFITIKLHNAKVLRKNDLRDLENDWEKTGISKAVSAQGVIYRIPKAA